MLKRILLLAIFLLFAYASTLPAAVPPMMNFQGILTNASGSPLVSTSRTVQFTIYDNAVAGAVQWAETLTVNTDASGRFNTILGQVHPLTDAVFSGTDRYLGLTVASDPELAPRSRIVSVGYANRVSTVDGATGGIITGDVTLQSTLTADNLVAGDATTVGTIRMTNGNGTNGLDAFGTGSGGAAYFYDEAGNYTHWIFPYGGPGEGSMILLGEPTLSYGIGLHGDGNGADNPLVLILGASNSALFDMSSPGDPSVILPVDAISSPEILDEPGVASISGPDVTPGAVIAPVTSRTITCPAAGYVIAIATGETQVFHTTGTFDQIQLGLSSNSTTIPGDQDLHILTPAALPSDLYLEQFAAVEVFAVGSAGPVTYYLNGWNQFGAASTVYDANLALLYVPTTYGTVSALAAGVVAPAGITAGNQKTQESAVASSLNPEAERVQSIADNNARIEKELAALKAELAEMKKQLGQPGSLQAPNQQQK